jgi:hypothetical protein
MGGIMKSFVDPVRLGIAGGIIWGIGIFVMTLICLTNGYAREILTILTSIYPGYVVSVSGSLIGFLYGFASALIFLFVFGWIYNLLGIKKSDD